MATHVLQGTHEDDDDDDDGDDDGGLLIISLGPETRPIPRWQ